MNAIKGPTNTAASLPALSIAADLSHALARLAAVGPTLIRVVRQWLHRSRYRYELSELSDRQLADMGIDREMLEQEIRKPFWLV